MKLKSANQVKKFFFTDDDVLVARLLKELALKFGIPDTKQVLTLYYEGSDKLVLRCDMFKGEISSKKDNETKGESAKQIIFKAQNLGATIGTLSNMGHNRASISSVLQLDFNCGNNVCISYLKDTLISKHQFEIVYTPPLVDEVFNSGMFKQIWPEFIDLIKVLSQINSTETDLVIDSLGVPNKKILDYCKHVNLSWTSTAESTYFHKLNSTSNDYSEIAEIFTILTGSDINGTEPSADEIKADLPSLSIIIPCLNVNSSLIKTLKSINFQKPGNLNFEVILVDDGSTIPVKDMLDEAKLSLGYNLVVIRKEKNTGISQSRNMGAAIARNEILLFIDGDIVLTNNYLFEHLLRHKFFQKSVLVSFKENVESSDPRVGDFQIESGLELPDYRGDLRINKYLDRNSMGYYPENYLAGGNVFTILSDTNYFKSLGNGRRVGVYDLPSMVIGHNFSMPKNLFQRIGGFDNKFEGYGLEDSYIGIKCIADGAFVIPVLSCGVYHLNHPIRRGNEDKIRKEFEVNSKKITELLSSTEQ